MSDLLCWNPEREGRVCDVELTVRDLARLKRVCDVGLTVLELRKLLECV